MPPRGHDPAQLVERDRGRAGDPAQDPRPGLVRRAASGRSSGARPAGRPAVPGRTRRTRPAGGAGCSGVRSRSSSSRSSRSRSSTASPRHGSGRRPTKSSWARIRSWSEWNICSAYGRACSTPEQVGPADRPDQERAAGEQQQRLVGPARIGDRVGDVLGRVAGRVDDLEAQRPDAARRRRRPSAGARSPARRPPRSAARRRSRRPARGRPRRSRCGGGSRSRG